MATASALERPAWTWHARGTWNARDDRLPSAAWLCLLWLGLIGGFGVDIKRFLHEAPPAPAVIYVHAAVFTGWMFLLTAQVLLVVGDRVPLHRRLGWFTAGWACLMAVLGPWAAFASQSVDLHGPEYDPPFLAVQLGDIAAFLIFVAWAIALRKNVAAHKRIMILSTIALVDAGFGRFSGWIWPNEPQSVLLWFLSEFYGNVFLLLLITAWDWWRGRLMKQFVIGATALLVIEWMQTLLYRWMPWKTLTTALITTWARHFA
ncbi:MAG TPA: hypothetical protein VMB47_02850 [Candidatus Aquilonibacter sp.]|nr:hypothetical protein [Candidatus Aquilonibacter sp.]